MKILLFILGSIEDRINAWKIEGFQSLFEQDIILWGPIPDNKFMYKDKEIPIISIFEQTTIKDVFNKLPEDWYPDIVTCETSVLSYVQDIYLCPVKTILFTRDAWTDTIFNRSLVELFDFINHSVIDRSLYNSFHVKLLPLSSFAVSTPDNNVNYSDFERREIDVVAIANYNSAFYHERYKTLYKLSNSNRPGFKIKYFRWIKRNEIHDYYQRSKIVIDWAHTLSNRSYEAALNGCLLFSHKDNDLIREFWTPWEEYVPYDDNNVLELVTFYIKNPDHAKKIISNAQEKIKTIPASWGQYVWENINIAFKTNTSIQERIKQIESLPVADLYYRSATPLIYNYRYNTNFPSDWKAIYFERIDKALSDAENEKSRIEPLVEAARVAFILGKSQLSLKYLTELQKIIPDYAWIYYLKGRMNFEQNEINQALLELQTAIACGLKAPGLLKQFVLPFIEKGNPCDSRRITDYLWQHVYNNNNEFQVKALLHLTYELKGDIELLIGDKVMAVNSYEEAINCLPVPKCILKLNPLLVQSKEFEKLLEISEKGTEDSPFESNLILYKAYALLQLKQESEAFKILKRHQKALKSFIGDRKMLFLRKSINLIIFFAFWNKYLGSKIINKMIRILY